MLDRFRWGAFSMILIVVTTATGATTPQTAPAGSITGTVVTADDKAAAKALVTLGPEGEFMHSPIASGTTDSQGAFTLTGIPEGKYVLRINSSSDPRLAAVKTLYVGEGQTVKAGKLTLKPRKR